MKKFNINLMEDNVIYCGDCWNEVERIKMQDKVDIQLRKVSEILEKE